MRKNKNGSLLTSFKSRWSQRHLKGLWTNREAPIFTIRDKVRFHIWQLFLSLSRHCKYLPCFQRFLVGKPTSRSTVTQKNVWKSEPERATSFFVSLFLVCSVKKRKRRFSCKSVYSDILFHGPLMPLKHIVWLFKGMTNCAEPRVEGSFGFWSTCIK